jgi:hypothetical protein
MLDYKHLLFQIKLPFFDAIILRLQIYDWSFACFFFFSPVMAQEDGVGLLTAIKGTSKYRRSKRIDFVSDYLPPSTSEFKSFFEEAYG